MKVWIENSDKKVNQVQGKSLFCFRLARALEKRSITVVAGTAKADVSINVIRIKHQNSRVKILRLDGVWHNTAQDYIKKNKSISRSIQQADAVIYQSNFSLQMGNKYLGETQKPTRVISNGSDASFYKKIKPAKLKQKNIIIAFSKWRPHKRLRDIIMSYMLVNLKDSLLVIAGDLSKSGLSKIEIKSYMKHPSVYYVGNLPQKELAAYLKVAKVSIHLCWFDSCPNSVVEAIVAGVPVICNNVGGTSEIVKPSSGYVCNVDKPYNMSPVDLYHPPKINRKIISEALCDCVKTKPVVNKKHVLIDNIAGQYLNFIKELL